MIEVRNADAGEDFAATPVRISIDGRQREVEPGQPLRLVPGESITLLRAAVSPLLGRKGHG